ncbi:MAG: glycosyltransferase [Bauldia sp.]
MIPPLIHQTWHDERIPAKFADWAASWEAINPTWRRILWTDRMLLEFVAERYPDFLEIYCSYPANIMRADAGRYLLLDHFGGVYADLDAECVAPLDPLAAEPRLLLCHEPPTHWALHAPYRSHPFVLFNGVMASPAGHPFWRHLLERMRGTRFAADVLDATGPCLLTGAYLAYGDKAGINVRSCQLFTPKDAHGKSAPPYGEAADTTLTRHYWAGTWWSDRKRRPIRDRATALWHRARNLATRGPRLDPAAARATVDATALGLAPPRGERLAILVPVRNAAMHIEPFLAAVGALDHRKSDVKLVFCEGDSEDDSAARLASAAERLKGIYREVIVTRMPVGTRFPQHHRSMRRYQRSRRAGLAKVRNHLIDVGLDASDDWALWIDIDVWRFPPDIVSRLRAANARIVVPNCVTRPGGPTYDLNTFRSSWNYPRHVYHRHLRDGLFQPPARFRGRLYLDGLRHSDRVELDGVGGTMLLVDAALHRAGLRFPEQPYRELIETEGFGQMAADLGIRPVGLPRVEIVHVPW